MRIAAVVLSLLASPVLATDCFVPVVQQVKQFAVVPQYQVVQKFAAVKQVQQYSAIGYQYHAPVYVSVGSHYRSSRAESVDATDLELLKRFKSYLEAEKSIAESRQVGILEAKCASCHNASKSGGGHVFDGSVALGAETKSAMMRAALSGSMPPSERLSSEELAELADQLFLEKW